MKEASVEGVQRRTKPKKHFMFCVKVSWSDGTVNLVYRRYSEFLHLQTMLFQAFPGPFSKKSSRRQAFTPLPDSFSSRINVGESIFTRMEQVSFFIKDILAMDYIVAQSQHVIKFLTPTQEDLEPISQPRKIKVKKANRGRRGSTFTQTVRGRFTKKTKIWGNKISSPIILEHFVVMDDYKKIAKSDINLKKGKVVDVIEKRECGWWLVESEGEVGWAPALYLEPADEMTEYGNIQTFQVGRGEFYVTAKRYVASEDDELSFEIGVNLQILEKNYDGWWKASYLGREGLVPAMYLKRLGYDRRQSRNGRRKSRLFAKNQLRDFDDGDDDNIGMIREIPEFGKESKKKTKLRFAGVQDNGDSNGAVVEGSDFLQLNKRNKKQKAKASEETSGMKTSLSSLMSSLHSVEEAPEPPTNDDRSMEISQSRSVETSEMPEINEIPESNPNGTENTETEESENDLNDLSPQDSNSASGNENDTGNLQHDLNGDDKNINYSDGRNDSATTTENAESPESVSDTPINFEVPLDSSRHFKTISLSEDSPRLNSPMRPPPVPSGYESPRTAAPRRVPPSPSGKLMRQAGIEKEKSEELNDEIQKWSSSDDESDPELAQMSFNTVVLHHKTSHSPAIVVDETGEPIVRGDETEEVLDHDERMSLDGSIRSTESFEIQVNVTGDEDDLSINIYLVIEDCEVDDEMRLSKGEYVQVLDKASTGFWLVKNKGGMKGWLSSSLLCPAPQVNGETECTLQQKDFEEEEEEGTLQMSCRAVEDYKGDLDSQEIDLQSGEYLRILRKSESGWWFIQNEQGEVGWAPSNYLEEFNDDEDIEFSR